MPYMTWPLLPRGGLQVRLAAMLVVAIAAIAVADLSGLWGMRQQTIAAAQAETSNLAESLGNDVSGVFQTMDAILIGMRERVRTDGTGPEALQRLAGVLAENAATTPKLHSQLVVDSSGNVLVSAAGVAKPPMDMSRSSTFLHHLGSADGALFISPPVRSVLDGKWVIKLSRRVNRADGSIAGVVIACVPTRFFEDFFSTFDVGRDGVITLATQDGLVMARMPPSPGLVGRDVSKTGVFWTLLKSNNKAATNQANFEATSGVDGTRRLISFHLVTGTPVVVFVGRGKAAVLSGWRMQAIIHVSGLCLLTGLILELGRRLAYRIGEGERSSQLLQQTVARMRQSERALLQAHADAEAANQALGVANRALETMALQDALTGLANRRQFDSALNLEFRRTLSNASPLALIMIDVDHFKQFNDCYGHPAGDACLRAIAATLPAFARRHGDIACRYGGEEMALLLPDCSEDQATDRAERIAQAVRDLAIPHPSGRSANVTISAGIAAIVPAAGVYSAADLIAHADEALYEAKHSGRDQVLGYSTVHALV
jgi:diguanylate cyclase (GGDEF)-like protein